MKKVMIFSGAGLSAESGISTFRDNNGLWEEYDVNIVCNHDSLEKNEKNTIEFYDKRRAELKLKEPNYAHKMIAKLKLKYKGRISVITQNVDDLFEKAGLEGSDVVHLHGFMTEIKCRNIECNTIYQAGYEEQNSVNKGLCIKCNHKLRPNVVFFGEAAPNYAKLHYEKLEADMVVVIGTSGEVIDVNKLRASKKISILNNLEPSRAIKTKKFTKVLYKPATQAIDEIVNDIEQFLNDND